MSSINWGSGEDSLYPNNPTPMEVTYKLLSQQESIAHASELAQLAEDTATIYGLPENATLLGMTKNTGISGITHPMHGLVGIAPALLVKPEVAVFTSVHEAVHARLGNAAVSEAIDSAAPGFREHFHKVLVPAWLNGEIDFQDNLEYLSSRDYASLVPGGWKGPHGIRMPHVIGTTNDYFKIVGRDMVTLLPYGGWYHSGPDLRSWEAELAEHPIQTPEVYSDRIQLLASLLLTGMSVSYQLLEYSRNNDPDFDLLAWEEGVANRIASDLTGMSLEAVQQEAAQDDYKLQLAYKLAEAGLHGQQLAEEVTSYDDLRALLTQHF